MPPTTPTSWATIVTSDARERLCVTLGRSDAASGCIKRRVDEHDVLERSGETRAICAALVCARESDLPHDPIVSH